MTRSAASLEDIFLELTESETEEEKNADKESEEGGDE